jgi:Putative zinc-finger
VPTERNGDGLDSLLRKALERSTIAGQACPDAETVAAWHDGVLSRADARAVERHVADCARCRALTASLVRSQPPGEESVVPLWRRFRLQWIVPLAATASAVAIWMAVPSRDASPPVAASAPKAFVTSSADQELELRRQTLDALKQRQEALAPQAAAPVTAPAREAEATSQLKSLSGSGDAARGNAAVGQRPLTVPAAPPGPAAPMSPAERPLASAEPAQATADASVPVAPAAADALQLQARDRGALSSRSLAERVRLPIEIVSPDPAVRWRVLTGAVEVSRSGGAQWTTATLPDASPAEAVTAGHAPDGQTCWLVGRAGLVLRSTNAVTFVRVPFQPAVDLVSVRAQNAQQAVVTTVDGRQFGTADGGASWEGR